MVLMLCLVTGNAGAVVIKGTVSDTLTNASVESVLVTVKGTATQAYTNSQGVFTINITSDIRDRRASVPALAWSALREAEIRVYGVNGTYRETGKTNDDLTGLPDGMYLIEAEEHGQVYTGKIVKIHDRYQDGVLYGTAGKAAAAVTLVYMHAYYNTTESAATEGDTGVLTKIKLLPPGPATTGPRTTSLVNMTPLEALNSSGTIVTGRRITGGLTFSAPTYWQHTGPDPRGGTYTFVDCEIQGGVSIITASDNESGNGTLTPDSLMVTLNMSYCYLSSGFSTAAGCKGMVDHCSFHSKSQWSVNDVYNPGAAAPGHTFNVFRNCYFWAPYLTQPSHYEVVQSFSKEDGLTVINCTFDQQGGALANSGITAIMNLALAPDNVFDHCFFFWDGGVPAYYALYAAGNGTFKNCFIEDGAAFLYPGSQCTFTSCRNFTTGSLLSLP
jgi:hypothetical protein